MVNEPGSSPLESAQEVSGEPPGIFERSPAAGAIAVLVFGILLIIPLLLDVSPGGTVLGRYSLRLTAVIFGLFAVIVLVSVMLAWRTQVWKKSGKGRPPFRKLIFYSVVLFFVAVLTEAGFRYFVDAAFHPHDRLMKYGNVTSPYLFFEQKPDAQWSVAGATYHTDANGFRKGASVAKPSKPPGVVRVAAVGASSVFGYGLDDDSHWPALLLDKLNTSGQKWEVINAGNNAYNSFQAFLKIYKRVIQFSPEVILIYMGFNDKIQSSMDFNRTFHYDYFYFRKWSHQAGKENAARNWYLRHLVTVYFADYLLDRLQKKNRDPEGIGSDDTDYYFRTNMALISDLCRRNGIRLVFVTFAHGYEKDSVDAVSISRRNQALREIATGNNDGLIDYAAVSAGSGGRKSLFMPDGYHPSSKGAVLIAETVAEYLAPLYDQLLEKRIKDR